MVKFTAAVLLQALARQPAGSGGWKYMTIKNRTSNLPGAGAPVSRRSLFRKTLTFACLRSFEIHVVEHVEGIHAELHFWPVLISSKSEIPGQVQVHVGVARSKPCVAAHAKGTVVKYRVVIVVVARGDVKRYSRIPIDHRARPEFERQTIGSNQVNAMTLVEVRPSPFIEQVVIIRRAGKQPARVVEALRKSVMGDEVHIAAYTQLKRGCKAIASRRPGRFELVYSCEIRVGEQSGSRSSWKRGINVSGSIKMQTAEGRVGQREIVSTLS